MEQIKEYFEFKHIKMTKSDLHLFYNTLKELNIPLPNIENLSIIDERVDLYNLYWGLSFSSNYIISKLKDDKYITTHDYEFNIKRARYNLQW